MALTADNMTFFMVCEMVIMAPFLCGNTVLFDMKKLPPARLHAYGSLRYPELMCEASGIWMHE